ncbi:MAG: magnesium chelatase [Bacteroidetes bacterium HGW-Bacteroidetes-6]|jgi:magnesium chelatase family protein|nr:MAG: magnesium chelatase [Bacteroidetes bacterium HGW-Bacteroidetes-6]
MLAKINSCAIHGIDAYSVTVEVDVTPGMHTYMAGLPDNAVKESRSRIEPALNNNGYYYPGKKITINFAPADIKKEGSSYDLAIIVGILAASGQISCPSLSQYMLLGEISLDGSISPVRGVLSAAIQAQKNGLSGIIVPSDNAQEASVVKGLCVYAFRHLTQVVSFLGDPAIAKPFSVDYDAVADTQMDNLPDFRDVKGQENVKRALEIAAAGGHNAIMIGPPGSGKTMLAKRISSILPNMSLQEALEATRIHSVAGKLGPNIGLLQQRPFRSPHHTISDVALVGGGTFPQPGEISLAHNGVLFLDELPEFKRAVLEVLRQPIEDRVVTISRAKFSVDYPASIMLIAAMNPCPCGYYNHPEKECSCGHGNIRRYLSRISGPLLDRIDIHIEVTPVAFNSLADKRFGESSSEIRKRVVKARGLQITRFEDNPNISCNAQLSPSLLKKYCNIDSTGETLLKNAMEKLNLSARAYDRILRVARTVADLENSESIQTLHLAEAIQYRSLDRESWGLM